MAAIVLASVLWAAAGVWGGLIDAGQDVVLALWTVPFLLVLHLVQLLLSSVAWSLLLGRGGPGLIRMFGLRLIREGLNSMLPVAHVGGEVVAVRLLARPDGVWPSVPVARAAASAVVDVTMEVCSQAAVLLAALLTLEILSGAATGWLWAESVATAALVAGGLVAAQRFGALRLLEAVVRRIGARFPALSLGGLDGLNGAARAIYRRPWRLAAAFLLQTAAWLMGVGETWLILHALGVDPTPAQAFVVETLGLAARSAGFAVPGALAVQEGGFVLAAAAVGLPEVPALALSLVKRVRELLIGLAGLALWQWERKRAAARAIDPRPGGATTPEPASEPTRVA